MIGSDFNIDNLTLNSSAYKKNFLIFLNINYSYIMLFAKPIRSTAQTETLIGLIIIHFLSWFH